MRDDTECRSYIDHLFAEHRRLHAMLGQARLAMRGAEGRASCAEWTRALRQVRDELKRHFTMEEEGGCMDQAVSYCPRLSGEARRIEAEHPELLDAIDRLIRQVSSIEQTAEIPIAAQDQFDELCRRLHMHEAAENELLRQGFGESISE